MLVRLLISFILIQIGLIVVNLREVVGLGTKITTTTAADNSTGNTSYSTVRMPITIVACHIVVKLHQMDYALFQLLKMLERLEHNKIARNFNTLVVLATACRM